MINIYILLQIHHNRIHDHRTAQWESIADDTNSGSFHGDTSSKPSHLYRASDRESQQISSNSKQPLLDSSNSGFYTQNIGQRYHSFQQQNEQTMTDQPRPLSEQQPFMTTGLRQIPPMTYTDVNTRPRGQSSEVEAVQDINLGPDDDDNPEIQTSVDLEVCSQTV